MLLFFYRLAPEEHPCRFLRNGTGYFTAKKPAATCFLTLRPKNLLLLLVPGVWATRRSFFLPGHTLTSCSTIAPRERRSIWPPQKQSGLTQDGNREKNMR